jgi:hypothetical protein
MIFYKLREKLLNFKINKLYSLTQWYYGEFAMKHCEYPFNSYQVDKALKKYNWQYIIDNSIKVAEEFNFKEIMRYCKDYEKNNYKTTVKNGKLQNINGEVFDTINMFKKHFNGVSPKDYEKYLVKMGVAIQESRRNRAEKSCFIIDKNNDLYIFPYCPSVIHHTFTGEKEVKTAGMIDVNDGKISYLSNKSGHFQAHFKSIKLVVNKLQKLEHSNFVSVFDKKFNPEKDFELVNHIDFDTALKNHTIDYFQNINKYLTNKIRTYFLNKIL